VSIENPSIDTAVENGWSTPWGKVTLAGIALAIVAVVLDVVSRLGDQDSIRNAAQWVMIAGAVVALIGAVMAIAGGVPVKGIVVVAGVVLLAIGIWWRDHYAVAEHGSPWRVIGISAIGVLLALGGVAMRPMRRAGKDTSGTSGPVSV
jgi:hypothetical protein